MNPANVRGELPTSRRILPAAFVLFLLSSCLLSPSATEQMVLGWIYFPLRVLPQVTIDWPAVILSTICAALFFAGLHMLLRRCVRQLGPSQATRKVSLRLSGLVVLGIFLVFAAGTVMVGATHQLVWLMNGRANRPSDIRAQPVFGFVSQAMHSASRTRQRNDLRMIGLGIANYHDLWSALPPGGTIDKRGRLLHGWGIHALMNSFYFSSEIDYSIPWDEPPNDRFYRCAIPIFMNPAIPEYFDQQGFGLSHLAGNIHVLPIVRMRRPQSCASADEGRSAGTQVDKPLSLQDIRDGISNTILIGQAAGNFRPWGHPANVRDPALGVGKTRDGFGGPPECGGALFLMCDGSVRFISNPVEQRVINALATPAGDEPVDLAAAAER
jgi:hypothetical protein